MNCNVRHSRVSRNIFRIGLCFVSTFLMGLGPTAKGASDRHVVVVCIDGFAAYLLDDPKAPVPTLRKLAKEGAVAEGGMKVSNPSITWPNHTTLVSGVRPEKHGVLANGFLVRGAVGVPVYVEPKKDKKDLVRVPTLFDIAHAKGLTTADVNWPCTRGADSLDDSLPDAPEQITHMTPRLRDELIQLGVLADATDKSFAANSAAFARRLVPTIDPGIADFVEDAFLELPVGMDDFAKGIEIVPLQFGLQVASQLHHATEHLLLALLGPHCCLLVLENG